MPKPHSKLLAFNKIYYEIQKKYGFYCANEWLEKEWTGELYLHDANSSTFRSYCFAYDLKDLAEKGLYFIEGRNAQPAQHLITFVDFVKEFISFASNRTSGACGLPNLIPYMYYFWRKDIESDYLGIKTSHNEKYYAKQAFQRFIYAVNQPYVRDRLNTVL
jgi:ribonucleoside-triphosphate reductase